MRWIYGAVGCALVTLSFGCESKPSPTAASAASEPEPAPERKPGAAAGANCSANQDCGQGLGCAEDKTCQPFKTIECRGREDACKREGRCTGSDKGGCVASSDAECKKATVCEADGRCTAKDGKCVATGPESCKTFCPLDGRCSVVDDKCAAASHADCRQSETCKQQKRCIAKKGMCVKN
jgi:hypothetical protein